jgi:hypothetical protein
MGRKNERLREELDIVEAERHAYKRRAEDLEHENAALRARMGITDAPAPLAIRPPLRTVSAREDSEDDDDDDDVNGDGHALAVTSADRARIDDAERAIAELRNPSEKPQPGETMTDIVNRNNWERSELNTRNRVQISIISRVASALQVTKWNEDGDEILERAQRLATFNHWLTRRIKDLNKQGDGLADGTLDKDCLLERVDELHVIACALTSPENVSRFIQDRQVKSAPGVLVDSLAAADLPKGNRLKREDLVFLRDAVAAKALEQGSTTDAHPWLTKTIASEAATKDLLTLLNEVFLPVLVRR